jgi:hypothetical protein
LFQNMSCCMSLYLSYIILYKNFFEKSKSRKKSRIRVKSNLLCARWNVSWSRRTLPTSLSLTCNSIANQDVAWVSYHRLSYCPIRNFSLKINLFAFHRLTTALGAARYFNQ